MHLRIYVHTCRDFLENKFGGGNFRLSNIEGSSGISYNDFIIDFEDNSEGAKPFSFLSPLAPLEKSLYIMHIHMNVQKF